MSFHRSFSPPKPPMSFSARTSFFSHWSMSYSSSAFRSTFSFNLSFRPWSLSSTSFKMARFSARVAFSADASASAFACASSSGAMALVTSSNLTMASTHLAMPAAAELIFVIFSVEQLGLTISPPSGPSRGAYPPWGST